MRTGLVRPGAVLALLVALLLLGGAGAAVASPAALPPVRAVVVVDTGPVLDPDVAAELATTLEEAREEQDVCYGWEIEVDDATGLFSGLFVGSDQGVGVPVDTSCPRWVALSAFLRYTSESSESEDSASWSVVTSPSLEGVATGGLDRLGLSSGDLTDDDRAEAAVESAVAALPVFVAEAGVAVPVPLETSDDPLPAGASPSPSPGSDWLRARVFELVLLVLLAVGAVAVLVLSFPRPKAAASRLVDAVSRH